VTPTKPWGGAGLRPRRSAAGDRGGTV